MRHVLILLRLLPCIVRFAALWVSYGVIVLRLALVTILLAVLLLLLCSVLLAAFGGRHCESPSV